MTTEQMVHVTNFGYAYCVEHGVEQEEMLGEKCGIAHRVEDTIPASSVAGYCDWPGCSKKFSGHPPRWED